MYHCYTFGGFEFKTVANNISFRMCSFWIRVPYLPIKVVHLARDDWALGEAFIECKSKESDLMTICSSCFACEITSRGSNIVSYVYPKATPYPKPTL
jgi:hypothetical protein